MASAQLAVLQDSHKSGTRLAQVSSRMHTVARLWLTTARSLLLLVAVSVVSSNAQARVEALLDRNEIYVNETVTLVIESSVPHGPSPDVGPLRQVFNVETGNTNSRTKVVNGAQFSLTRWTYLLTPKETGIFTIPAIVVRGEITVPITLKVTDVPEDVLRETATHARTELEIIGGDHEPYVQQQLILSLRLLYDETVTSGESTEPVVPNAVIEKFRGEQNYTAERDGRQYRVYEQRFVISAESSGELVIPPITFSGTMASVEPARPKVESSFEERIRRMLRGTPLEDDPFFMEDNFRVDRRNTGRPFSVVSNEIRLNVRPRPAEAGASPWLPARELVIVDSWETDPPQMQAGQPVQRRLLLKAKGLVASQIPDLEIVEPDNARMYMEPPFVETPTDSQSINGQREHIITYIPDRAGELIIPEVRVDWWNTDEDAAQTAMLEARTFDVMAGAATTLTDGDEPVSDEAQIPAQSETVALDASDSGAASDAMTQISDATDTNATGRWYGRLVSVPLLLTLITVAAAVLLWLSIVRRRGDSTQFSSDEQTGDSLSHRLRALQLAQNASNAPAAGHALLRLAQMRWPQSPPRNLGALVDRLNSEGIDSDAVLDLERHLFSNDDDDWRPAALRQYLNPRIWIAETPARRGRRPEGLAPLYPKRVVSAK